MASTRPCSSSPDLGLHQRQQVGVDQRRGQAETEQADGREDRVRPQPATIIATPSSRIPTSTPVVRRDVLIFSKRSQQGRTATGTQWRETRKRRSSTWGHRRSVGLGNRCSIP
ncbi:hypothetical protein AB0F95_03980 [Micromonospora tulbaghiae]|uniref:hypothetical protein n=1 Tax=Micromonospora tulbaghiae TaxID=479978 RepID=UPI0033EE85B8